MKIVKPTGFIASGILVLLLAGCFNPITVVPPKTSGDALTEPFTVDVVIGNETAARSVASLTFSNIKQLSARNIFQLIVVDKEAEEIVAFDEVRKKGDGDTWAELRIEAIPFNRTYHFLLLMGYWEYQKDGEGNYLYTADPPTLLAAGLEERTIIGSETITITMWPLVVDTVFTTTDMEISAESRRIEPEVSAESGGWKPKTVSLYPVEWGVTWRVKRGTSGDGFMDLIRAQKVLNEQAGDELVVKSKSVIVRGDGLGDRITIPGVAGNVISLSSLGTAYTSGLTRVGKKGSVNFKLEYVPFNLTDNGVWTKYNDDSVFTLNDNAPPVWIIRNGINDEAQNANTDFANLRNGNGAVSYLVNADGPVDPGNPQTGDLVVKDGRFEGPVNSTDVKIGFKTEGYTGTAEGYYAVVAVPSDGPSSPPSDYSRYKSLGPLEPKVHERVSIELDEPGNDVYVVILKGGKMSVPLKISTSGGSPGLGWEWGEE